MASTVRQGNSVGSGTRRPATGRGEQLGGRDDALGEADVIVEIDFDDRLRRREERHRQQIELRRDELPAADGEAERGQPRRPRGAAWRRPTAQDGGENDRPGKAGQKACEFLRVRDLSPSDLSGDARSVCERIEREYEPFGNMLAVIAHRPQALELIFGLLLTSRANTVISKRHLEIVLLSASAASACDYCIAHHAPRLVEQGLPQEAADRILDETPPGFDAVDLVVRDYAVQITRDPKRVSDALFGRLREVFTEEQVVEITLRAALCSFFNRFNEGLRIEIEAGVRVAEIA